MHHYVYAITNILDGKVYVGKHSTANIDDGYMGSGKLLSRAIVKYGLENFRKDVLGFFNTEIEALDAERQLVTEEFVSRNDTYNLIPGGQGGFAWINKYGCHIGRPKIHSADTRRLIGESSRNRKHDDATKLKISENNQRTNESRGTKVSAALKGKKKTQAHRDAISESLKRRKQNASIAQEVEHQSATLEVVESWST